MRRIAGKIGAYTTHSRHNTHETTALARTTFLDHFVEQVDPDRSLSQEERARRVKALKRAYFLRLALRSMDKRARKAASIKDAAVGLRSAAAKEDSDVAADLQQ